MRFFGDYFWGVFLITIGVLFLLKQVFHINIPIFKLLLGIFFIYLGISIMFGGSISKTGNNIIFNQGTVTANNLNDEYNVIFSEGTIDLTGLDVSNKTKRVKVNAVFGSADVKISPDTPTVIRANSAFAATTTPDSNSVTFGNHTYRTKSFNEGANYLEVETNSVFGRIIIRE